MEIAIVGATGQTGSSIVDALLASDTPELRVTALTRPSSLKKPAVLGLAKRGVKIAAADLDGPQADLEKMLAGVDVVISTIYGGSVLAEISLINASQAAGVKRYIPCFFATVAPPKGVLLLRELKEDVLNHIKKIKLPYTVIDVGWWYQVNLPRLPSGRIDYAVMETSDGIAGDGNVPIALTDSRTLNRMVFSYTEVVTHNQIYDLLEGLSGEKLERRYVPAEAIEASIAEAEAKQPSPDSMDFVVLAQYQYWYSCGVRGDNTPENARYLGSANLCSRTR
ncbi:isoflavone reductase family protein [Colletotrichum tofieldiae]|uniref:Isoflavone reductase family protein n=1 Tax=Colletotrichum tofieldiae TaxID=708197 RepID=A0A166LWD2_9PEZI|nr:isoflavone reductase family protein [Colletotrichum tofieldiae]GKT62287.1 isoflavone reductase family protein [Colletotrichum tofieldiae]GKT69665.1 isoflavone reductase family protein [Colletotrichum tofieldiae]